MNAHLSDSDRQALRLAHDLREEMRAALPQAPSAPSVSPFVDQNGAPSVLLRMDADTARSLMALLAAHRGVQGGAPSAPPAQVRQADGSHLPPPPMPQAVPAGQGPVTAATFGRPAHGEPPFVQQYPGGAPMFTGGTGPTPLAPTPYPTH